MRSSFNLGVYTALCCMGLLQDFIGKEESISFITNYWAAISWYWWLIPIICFNVQYWFNEKWNNDLLKVLMQNRNLPKNYGSSFPMNPEEGEIFTDIKGNEYAFKNGIWKTTKNIKDELNKFNLQEENLDVSDKDVSWISNDSGSPTRISNVKKEESK